MDVSAQDFPTAVLERSRALPVVVDFWAEWCGPCRQLGPALERAAAARAGKLELVKVDVDANPELARTYHVQGIPAVKAFRDGEVVSEFVGNQPPLAIERFLDGLVPSEVDALLERGDEAALRQALELEPSRPEAVIALARLLRERGESENAAELLRRLPGNFAAEGLAARIKLETAPPDPAAPPELPAGLSALDAGELERALELLISSLQAANGARDDIRRVIVGILDELGPSSEIARAGRRRLAAALY